MKRPWATTAGRVINSTSGRAVYSPRCRRRQYPKPIFDKSTGAIDHTTVAEYWREHYDLNAILQREWATLGPKLQGKLHIYVGADDTYFLNDAVYLPGRLSEGNRHPGPRCSL